MRITQRTVVVRDLELTVSIGVHAHEKLAPQRLVVSVEATLDGEGDAADDIAATLDYDGICDFIRAIGRNGRQANPRLCPFHAGCGIGDRRDPQTGYFRGLRVRRDTPLRQQPIEGLISGLSARKLQVIGRHCGAGLRHVRFPWPRHCLKRP